MILFWGSLEEEISKYEQDREDPLPQSRASNHHQIIKKNNSWGGRDKETETEIHNLAQLET